MDEQNIGLSLSACIVNYGDPSEALKAAASVLEQTRRHPLSLFLVDNASPGEAGQALSRAAEDGTLRPGPGQTVRVICRKENGGFGAGHNTVLPLLKSEFHFILNPDILLTEDALSGLAEWMAARPDVVMARPELHFPSGELQVLPLRRCRLLAIIYRQLPFLGFLKRYNDAYTMADRDLTVPTEIEFCTGSFSAVRTEAFREAGGFDEGYFMYVEDADLTQKMRQKGKVYLVPEYQAVHEWHRAAHRSLRPLWWQLRSMFRYFSKWGFRL